MGYTTLMHLLRTEIQRIGTMKIFAVGMNYPQYNKKEGDALLKGEPPVVSVLADSSLQKNHKPFFVPDWSSGIECGVELVVRICRLGKAIPERFAHRYYDAITVGVGFTDREMERKSLAEGQSGSLCRSFDGASIIGDWVDVNRFRGVQTLSFRLDANGATMQRGYTGDMLHSIDSLVAYISRFCTLKTGDLLFTGAPAAGLKVNIGDRMEGYIDDENVLDFNCK